MRQPQTWFITAYDEIPVSSKLIMLRAFLAKQDLAHADKVLREAQAQLTAVQLRLDQTFFSKIHRRFSK